DPTAAIEKRRVDDPPARDVDVIRREAVEEGDGPGSGDLDLREARLVEEPGGGPGRERLGGDRRAPVLPRPAPRPERLERRAAAKPSVVGARFEPVHALP